MKNKCRLVSMVLAAVFLFGILSSYFSLTASAIDIEVGTGIQTQGLNDLTVRLAVNQYFAQREAFLKGNSESIALAVAPMVVDETTHKDYLDSLNIVLTDSSVTIDTISCGHNQAEAVVVENAVFKVSGTELLEEVEHIVHLYLDDFGTVRVSGDGYKENISNFVSCSYVDPEMVYEIDAGGSKLCITAVAETQIGEGEYSNGVTKYGTWFTEIIDNGNDYATTDWCAMFVYWCAYHANVSSSIIKATTSVPIMYEFFNAKNQYYLSKAWNSSTTFTPRTGDLIFIDDSPTSPNHIGIVTNCSGGYVYYIDGNSSDNGGDVRSTWASLTWPGIVGYGRPAYEVTSHTPSTSWNSDARHHWNPCSNCGERYTATVHSFTWIWNSMTHTKNCSVCNYSETSSHYFLINSEGVGVCQECGYEDDHNYIESTNQDDDLN